MQSTNLFSEIEGLKIDRSILSPEGSRASRTLQQDSEKALTTLATSGQTCSRQFASLNRRGSWAKTFAASLIGQAGWYSSKCKLTWKLSGTKYRRLYFQLVPSALHTEEIEFGLLPTVQTQGLKVCDENGKTQFMNLGLLPTPCLHNENGRSEGWSPSLLQVVNGLLPTPKARVPADSPAERKRNTPSMESLAAMGFLPTPTTSEGFKATANQNQDNLQKRFQTGGNSQLNPRFVGEMMGFPVDWLELPFQDTAANQSKPMDTP